MDIKQVKKEIAVLEKKLLSNIKAFEELTGAKVDRVDLIRPMYISGEGQLEYVRTDVSLEADYDE